MTGRARSRRPAAIAALPLVAAGLAILPLAMAQVDGDHDLDPFFAILAVASVVVAVLIGGAAPSRNSLRAATAIAAVWWLAAGWAAALLVMYQTACACSRVDPATLPPAQTIAGLPAPDLATILHVLATFGGGVLVALTVARARSTTRPSPIPRPAA